MTAVEHLVERGDFISCLRNKEIRFFKLGRKRRAGRKVRETDNQSKVEQMGVGRQNSWI